MDPFEEAAARRITAWMDEARQEAAQCWYGDETSDRVRDPVLAEAVAKRIAAWMDTAAQETRNTAFYRDLLDKCAEHLGDTVFIADDGSRQDTPIRLKIPELVRALAVPVEK